MEKLNFIIAKNLSELRRKNKLTQLEVAEKLCNKIAIIKNGKIIRSGPTDEVRGDSSLEDLFLELTEQEDEQA